MYEVYNEEQTPPQLENTDTVVAETPSNDIEKPKKKRRPSSKPLSEKQLEALRKGRESRRKPSEPPNINIATLPQDNNSIILQQLDELKTILIDRFKPQPQPDSEPPSQPPSPTPPKPKPKRVYIRKAKPQQPPASPPPPPKPTYNIRFL